MAEQQQKGSGRIRAGKGILHSGEFAGLAWDTGNSHAPMADVLRIHDWPYVRRIQVHCWISPDTPAHEQNNAAPGTNDCALSLLKSVSLGAALRLAPEDEQSTEPSSSGSLKRDACARP